MRNAFDKNSLFYAGIRRLAEDRSTRESNGFPRAISKQSFKRTSIVRAFVWFVEPASKAHRKNSADFCQRPAGLGAPVIEGSLNRPQC